MSAYDNAKELPMPVRSFLNQGGYLVGSAVQWVLYGGRSTPRDYDIIIPLHKWHDASRLIPPGSVANSFGGFKLQLDGELVIDVWGEDVDHYLITSTGMHAGVAINPFIGSGVAMRLERPFRKQREN